MGAEGLTMRNLIVILSFIFILAACDNESFDKEHLAYIENLGWTIKSFDSTERVMMELSPESIANYKASNITFIENYIGKKLDVTSYILNEKDPKADNFIVDVYEYEGEIIGTIGKIPNATPGVFNLTDKKD